ncbi:MAG: hypothetical protein JWM43_967 [Acidobacteriaceae bacterium]|nr:hypothetical protein [Acidobacteriaceae bacterium]
MVECFLAKEDVAGSTPVSRSNSIVSIPWIYFVSGFESALGDSVVGDTVQPHFVCDSQGCAPVATARRGTQVVRERSAKPLCVGSIPTRASKIYSFRINSKTASS